MSCRYLTSGGDRCAVTLKYVRHLSEKSEMYARNGFIASPIDLWPMSTPKMPRVNITTIFLCKDDPIEEYLKSPEQIMPKTKKSPDIIQAIEDKSLFRLVAGIQSLDSWAG